MEAGDLPVKDHLEQGGRMGVANGRWGVADGRLHMGWREWWRFEEAGWATATLDWLREGGSTALLGMGMTEEATGCANR